MFGKNIYEMLKNVCTACNDNVFFVRQRETYADLLKKVKQRAVMLAERFGVEKGDTVALLSGNTPEFIKSYFAIISQGAKVLMLDTGLSRTEHLNMMKRTDCKLALAQKSYFVDGGPKMFDIETADDADESQFSAADVGTDDLAMLSFTSGSTGNPKIVGLTHGNIISLGNGAMFYSPVIRPGYIFYGFLPLYHIYGVVINIIAPLVLRGSLLLQTELKPAEFLKDFQEYRPQVIPAVPRIWEGFYKKIIEGVKKKKAYMIMKIVIGLRGFWRIIGMGWLVRKVTRPIHEIFGGNAKVLVSAGATLKPRIRRFFERLGLVVGDCYGLTETTGPSNFNFSFRLPDGRMHYAGPLPGNEIKIHNPDKFGVGEVCVRGNLVMPGYVGNDAANAEAFEDGWFKTGDLGKLDSKNRLIIKGRKKQVIVLENGKNVYPDELEDLYLANDEILAAAVLERVIKGKVVPYAVFQVKPGTALSRVGLLVKASNLTIAPYKWVKHFAITEDELPQTSAKKIKHHEIRAMLDRGEFPNREE
ncbi:MAG: AMP-binding protein [Rickettsiales bacterium]|jgi:long-chain acyl-CoA synthetase|nr:AMP-binding protein [Rickettsiales bacterium]